MGGIAGFLNLSPNSRATEHALADRARRMTAALVHRGPDDAGVWVDPQAGVALGCQRLAIVDLSMAGSQPMQSASRRFVIVFDGEIYNHQEMRTALGLPPEAADSCFRGHSDTETLLVAIETWGLAPALRSAVGMFAIALWDSRRRVLSLARDRIGKKPLYYGRQGTNILFGSELKALRVHPEWQGTIDRHALELYLRYGYVPAPYSIYKSIRKLKPGTILNIDASRPAAFDGSAVEAYWSAQQVMGQALDDPFDGDEHEAAGECERVLRQAVHQQMVADVPLGAFLSNGIDSSLVVALMQSGSQEPVRTFGISFDESAFDESRHTRAVARHLQTNHTELRVTSDDALALLPFLPTVYDEPFANAAQITTYLASRLARQSVAVSLTGDGGDELFCGHGRHASARRLWQRLACLPAQARRRVAAGAEMFAHRLNDGSLRWLAPLMRSRGDNGLACDKLLRFARLARHTAFEEFYDTQVSCRWQPEYLLRGGATQAAMSRIAALARAAPGDLEHRMQFADLVRYLPDDVLTKVDRAAMAVGLETRMPFLDHRVIEFAWRLPRRMRVRNGQGNGLLRQIVDRYMPRQSLDRPKFGLRVPLAEWLCNPLHDWAAELLSPRRLADHGLFDGQAISRAWDEHRHRARDWHRELWCVLMFQAWIEAQRQAMPTALAA